MYLKEQRLFHIFMQNRDASYILSIRTLIQNNLVQYQIHLLFI